MAVIHKNLLQFIFSGAYMKRWNDKLRPMDLIEVDKQAHKMIAAWLLCQVNARNASAAEKLRLELDVVEGGIFDYLFRLVVTDIKPPVFYRIKQNPVHFAQLADWVLKELEPHIKPLGEAFAARLADYVRNGARSEAAARILDAAHHYASFWEFKLLQPLNGFDDELAEIEASFVTRLRLHSSLAGVTDLLEERPDSAVHKLATLCGQLRFQKRWSQTPRVPETSVIGHMFIVACYAYFFSLSLGACSARLVNNFLTGLLHDLPEVLTRDIISPVKKSVGGLDALVRNYEGEALDRRILGPLQEQNLAFIADRLRYYLGLGMESEFTNCVVDKGRAAAVGFDDLQNRYNQDCFDPKDGELVKICDNLAAFIEAYTAVRNGMASDQLHQAVWRLRSENRHRELGPLHIGAMFADFD